MDGDLFSRLLQNTLHLALESAPWLLFGLVAAGLIKAWLPTRLVGYALGGSGPAAVTRAALIGAPLPLCSCGTLPTAIELRRSGASKAATTSFLIATPETGVDSVALSWVLLGPLLAIVRPLAAILSAICAGLLVGRTEPTGDVARAPAVPLMVEPTATPCSGGGCGCAPSPAEPTAPTPGPVRRTLDGLAYAFSDLIDDLSLWLAFGLIAAGAVITLTPPDLLANWGSGLLPMVLILLVSIPMYVCATASTPLAHAMLYAGVSPGTVLVFLLAGPASNLASIALVRRELGNRALVAYLFGVGGVAILLGLSLDLVIGLSGIDPLQGSALHGEGERTVPPVLAAVSLLILTLSAIRPFRRYLVFGKGGKDGCCG